MFYDILDKMESNISEADPFALELQEKAKTLVAACRINLNKK